MVRFEIKYSESIVVIRKYDFEEGNVIDKLARS